MNRSVTLFTRTAFLSTTLFLMLFLQSGFKSNAQLFDKLKGKWRADKITYTLSIGDSTVQSPAIEFNFTGGGDPNDQHEGYYQFVGKSKYTFLYQLDSSQPASGELVLAVLSPPGQPLNRLAFFGTQPDFSSIWNVAELPGGVFRLKGESLIRRANGKEETIPTEILLKQ